ncbi:hypothetical protein [Thiohalomonas denitrificans]|uniref:hypothetical protein n=1 Tax=Thiohalomonas denitrificans TaxID=415747 RepID=UPI0026F0F2E9|nr:hypothetical protein [Thiohalomonas denitrificans]
MGNDSGNPHATLSLVRMLKSECILKDENAVNEKGAYSLEVSGGLLLPEEKDISWEGFPFLIDLDLKFTGRPIAAASKAEGSEEDDEPVFIANFLFRAAYKLEKDFDKDEHAALVTDYMDEIFTANREFIMLCFQKMGLRGMELIWSLKATR